MEPYTDLNPGHTNAERSLGKWLHEQAKAGMIRGVSRVSAPAPRNPTGKSNPDYRFHGVDSGLDADADAVIAESRNFENIFKNSLNKVRRQANNVVIELGAKDSAAIADGEVQRVGALALATSPGLKRLVVVRRDGENRKLLLLIERPANDEG